MPLTNVQMVQAEAAKRLLQDEALMAILNRVTADAAEKAVFLDDGNTREANRQLVLAIARIRGELQADADLPEATKAGDELSKSFE